MTPDTLLHQSAHLATPGAERTPISLSIMGITPARQWTDAVETSSHASRSPESTRRKRLSFFSRSNSNASEHRRPQPQPPSALHSAMSPQCQDVDSSIPPATLRPDTASSNFDEGRRRTSDQIESIRNSLFGGRKKTTANSPVNPPRPSSRQSTFSKKSRKTKSIDSTLIPFIGSVIHREPERAKEGQFMGSTAVEWNQHRKKASISSPFNFQHVTHTTKKHLPRLETVDEKDIKAKFWAVNPRHESKEQLHGIKAENLDSQSDGSGSGSVSVPLPDGLSHQLHASAGVRTVVTHTIGSQAAPPAHQVYPDETIFDETQETKFNPDDIHRSLEDVNNPGSTTALRAKPPKHYSSMSALGSPNTEEQHRRLREQGSLDSSRPNRSPPRASPPRLRASMQLEFTLVSEKVFEPSLDRRLSGRSTREKQSLPSVSGQVASKRDSRASVKSASSVGQLFPAPPVTNFDYPASVQSKQSSKSWITSNSSRSNSNDVLNETTWEDDIDFAYEQEAEARDDFDWENLREEDEDKTLPLSNQPSPSEGSGIESQGGGVRLSAWNDQPSTPKSDSSLSRARSSVDTTSILKHTRKRGPSVGHKGFAAARTASDDALKKSPSLGLDTASAQSTPPPAFNMTVITDAEAGKSPSTPSQMQFASFDSSIPDYLSDPESTRSGGSRHRKSSSYGSYESSGRSLRTVSDATRWSSASTSSIPDLMASKRKSRSSVRHSRASRPLESVPHSPDFDPGENSLAVPSRNSKVYNEQKRDSIIMRRPATQGDRQILYAAGRTVQRGRSSTPNQSRMAVRSSPDDEKAGWI